jgi:hypothetical protein
MKATVNTKIARAEKAISQSRMKDLLHDYSPEIVSTIFVEFDTEKSDIDIVCEYQHRDVFASDFTNAFGDNDSYSLSVYTDCVVGHFKMDGFLFEFYGSQTPVSQQSALRHYKIMQRLAHIGGEPIKQKIRTLKRKGLKTEPAICQVLRLSGEPYNAVLQLELWSDSQLRSHVQNCI